MKSEKLENRKCLSPLSPPFPADYHRGWVGKSGGYFHVAPCLKTAHYSYTADSHQVDNRGRLTRKRYKTLVPSRALVESNELSDKLCMMALGKEDGNLALATIPTPPDIRFPPSTLRFTFSHLGNTCNGDTPSTIERQVKYTLIRSAKEKVEQGRWLRILDSTNLTLNIIGRKGALMNLLNHTAQSHTQNCYRDGKYKDWHMKYGNVPHVEGKEAQKELLLFCPFCKEQSQPTLAKGNLRHFHLYCKKAEIKNVRDTVYDYLEYLLTSLFKTADDIREIASIPPYLLLNLNASVYAIPLNNCCLTKGEKHDFEMYYDGTPYTYNAID